MNLTLTKIIIENFFSYVGKHELDIKPGLTLVCGKNGAGKSSLMKLIEQSFGYVLKENSINSKTGKKSRVSMFFIDDEECDIYEFHRFQSYPKFDKEIEDYLNDFKADRNGFIALKNDEIIGKVKQNQTDAYKALHQVINFDETIFSYNTFFGTNGEKDYCKLNDKEHKSMFSKFMNNFEKIESCHTKSKVLLNTKKNSLIKSDNELKKLNISLNEKLAQKKIAISDKEEFNKKLKNINADIEHKENYIKSLNGKIENINKEITDSKVPEKFKDMDLNKILSVRDEIVGKKQKVILLLKEDIEKKIENINDKIMELNKTLKFYQDKQKENENITKLESTIDQLRSKRKELNDKRENIRVEILSFDKNVDKMRSLLEQGKCHVCQKPIEEGDFDLDLLKEENDKNKEELKKIEEKIEEINKFIDKKSKEKMDLEIEFRTSSDKCRDVTEKLKELAIDLEILNEKQKNQSKEQLTKQNEEYKKQLDEIDDSLKIIQSIESLRDKIKDTKIEIAKETNELTKTKNLTKDKDKYELRIKTLNEEVDSLSEKIFDLEMEIDDLKISVQHYEYVVSIFKPEGLQSFILDQMSEEFSKSATETFKKYFNEDIEIKITTKKELKTGGIREKFNVTAFRKDGSENIDSFSTGETKLINICALKVFRDFISGFGYDYLNLNFLDEFFANLKGENINNAIEFVKDNCSENTFITSNDFLENIVETDKNFKEKCKKMGFENILFVEKTNNESQIKYLL